MDPSENPTNIGRILLGFGWITEKQLAEALEIRTNGEDRRLSRILLGSRRITRGQLRQALNKQREMRGQSKKKGDAHRAICEACKSAVRVNANIDGLNDLIDDMTKGKTR